MKAAYGKKYQDRKKREETTSSLMSIYLGISLTVLHELWEFGQGRCVRLVEALNPMIDGGLEHYKERGYMGANEGVANLYYVSRRDLIDAGVDVNAIEKEYTPVIPSEWKWTYTSKGNPIDRKAYLDAIDLSVSSIWYLTALYLREEYGFGKVKLTRYYTRCRQKFMEFWKPYMMCNVEGDKICTVYRRSLESICLGWGVQI